MKYILLLICFLTLPLQAAVAAHTNGTSWSSGTIRGTYQWWLSAERLLATPEWNPESQAVPLPPDKACRLATNWLVKNKFDRYWLDAIEFLRYPAPYVGDAGEQFRKRFYYRLKYTSPAGARVLESMYVFVLLDGTVVEPSLTPAKEKVK